MALNLIARLGFDGTGFDRGLRGAEQRVSAWGKRMGGFLAASFGASAIFGFGRQTLRDASDIQDMADSLGLTAEQLQAITAAGKPFGAEASQIAKVMQQLSEARLRALGGGKEGGIFKSLVGIGSDELRNLNDGYQLLLRFSSGLQRVNVDANTLPLILDLIGARGRDVIPLLQAGLEGLAQSAMDTGQVMNNEIVARLDAADDAIERAALTLRTTFAPVVEWVANKVNEIVIGWKSIGSGLNAGAAAVRGRGVKGALNPIGTVGAFLGGFGKGSLDRFFQEAGAEGRIDRARQEARERRRNLPVAAALGALGGGSSLVTDVVRSGSLNDLAQIGGFTRGIDSETRSFQIETVRELGKIARHTERMANEEF